MLLTDTAKTKETALQKKLIEKRNLFGLGVTSLIAACSGAADGTGGGETEEERIAREAREAEEAAQTARANALPFKAGALTAAQANGYTAEIETTALDEFSDGTADELDVKITKDAASTFLNFPTGDNHANNRAYIHTLTPNLGQYDLVISAPYIDKLSSNNDETVKGRIFIYWNVEAVAAALDPKDSPYLEIKGEKKGDQIGTHPPEFLKIGGTDNKYDMVIRSQWVDKEGNGAATDEGAIYILWDIVDYDEATKTIELNPTELGKATTGATSGSLAIYGATVASGLTKAQIGTHEPEFLQLGGKEGNNHDMVIRSEFIYKFAATAGAIYILWDVEDYHSAEPTKKNKTIYLDELGNSGDPNLNATAGSLAIYGAVINDYIGTHAPDFLQIGGTVNNYDMVIRSRLVDKPNGSSDFNDNQGAIYVLWDVADYYQDGSNTIAHKTINLGATSDQADVYATFGLLTIYGATELDSIGTYAPDFLKIGGKDGDDMVIRSHKVDKPGSSSPFNDDRGAIYVLWDVEDYYGTGSDKNKTINLGAAVSADSGNEYATSGLLTIYGTAKEAKLGSNDNNILYDDGELTNIDNDTVGSAAGTKDIAFRDGSHTYILFGDKIANDASSDSDDKVDSKTIDLAKVQAAFVGSEAAGFFGYDFVPGGLGSATKQDAKIPSSVGYRFSAADSAGLDTLLKVQGAYEGVSKLSDADADLGVWDIA